MGIVTFGVDIREGLEGDFEHYSIPACMSVRGFRKYMFEQTGEDISSFNFYKAGEESRRLPESHVFSPGDKITVKEKQKRK